MGVEVINRVPQERTIDMYKNLGVLTVQNLFKLHLFKFLNLLLNGSLPYFYELLLRPLLSTHNYNTRAGGLRHPYLVCEVERRAIAYQLVLMHDEINPNLHEGTSVKGICRKFKRVLLSEQCR